VADEACQGRTWLAPAGGLPYLPAAPPAQARCPPPRSCALALTAGEQRPLPRDGKKALCGLPVDAGRGARACGVWQPRVGWGAEQSLALLRAGLRSFCEGSAVTWRSAGHRSAQRPVALSNSMLGAGSALLPVCAPGQAPCSVPIAQCWRNY